MSKEKRIKNPDNRVGFGSLALWQSSSVSMALSTLAMAFVPGLALLCRNLGDVQPVFHTLPVSCAFLVRKGPATKFSFCNGPFTIGTKM